MNPIPIPKFLKQFCHNFLKAIIHRWSIDILPMIDTLDEIIEEYHNQIIIIAAFPILKHNLCGFEVIVVNRINVVNLFYGLLQSFTHLG